MKKTILIFSLIFFSLTSFSQEKGISKEIKEYVKARINTNTDVGIAIGFIEDDTVEFFSKGQTAIENGKTITKNSVFEIGSISKTFTAILLAQKINDGAIGLDDAILKYLPDSVKVPSRNGKNITIRDLATHTSALPRMPDNFSPKNPNNPFDDYTYKQLYTFLSSHELTRDIGSQYEYSNLGMGLLGHILELQSNKTYEELVIQHIAKPLGMKDTAIALTDAMKKKLAKGHSGLKQVENWDIITLAGAGGIRSTVSDMVKFMQANMGITKTPLYEAMQLTHTAAYSNSDASFKIGLAWHYENNQSVIWHNGRTGGYTSFVGFVPETNKGVVVLTNNTADIGALSFNSLGMPIPLVTPKKSAITLLQNEIKANGFLSAIALYKAEKKNSKTEYDFNEDVLNTIGYQFLSNKEIDKALTFFKLNVAMYPKASNPYDSLAEALLENGEKEAAIQNYKQSLVLNPANENAREVLQKLGETLKEISVSQAVLDTYTSIYALMPTFKITVTTKTGKLFAQATGQPEFELFPSATNKFYLKVVEANVVFNANKDGQIESMTLFQNGQELTGKKQKLK